MRIKARYNLKTVIDDECKFSFYHIEVFAYYICSLVYLCHSLLEQQIKPALTTYIPEQVKGHDSLIKLGTKVQGRAGH